MASLLQMYLSISFYSNNSYLFNYLFDLHMIGYEMVKSQKLIDFFGHFGCFFIRFPRVILVRLLSIQFEKLPHPNQHIDFLDL